jgi:hypothetical protein
VKVFDMPERHGSMSFVSMATMRSSKSTPHSNKLRFDQFKCSMPTISVATVTGCVLVHGR